jgi:replicative DNA helicase
MAYGERRPRVAIVTTSPAPRADAPPPLPHSTRAEKAVLGSMLASPATVARAEELLRPEEFYRLQHQHVFRALLDLARRNVAVDLVTVETELAASGKLAEVGGQAYLQELFDVMPTAVNVEHYAEIVRDRATRRQYIAALQNSLAKAFDDGIAAADLAEDTERSLAGLSHGIVARPYHHIRDVVAEAYQSIESVHEAKRPTIGVSTGLRDLDALLSGLQATDLIVLAARPSVGKTALALHIAREVGSRAEGAALVFSLEMGRVQLALRLIAAESRTGLTQLRTGRFRNASWSAITMACGSLSNHRIIVDDARDTSLREMRGKARRVQAEHGLSLVVVDYLQLLEDKRRDRKFENRQTEVAGLSRGLKSARP